MFKFATCSNSKKKKTSTQRRFSYVLLHSCSLLLAACYQQPTEQADSILGPAHLTHCPNSIYDRPERASLIDLLTGLGNKTRPSLKQTRPSSKRVLHFLSIVRAPETARASWPWNRRPDHCRFFFFIFLKNKNFKNICPF